MRTRLSGLSTRMLMLGVGGLLALGAVLTIGIQRAANVIATHNTNNYLSTYSDVLVAAIRLHDGVAAVDDQDAVIAAIPRDWQISQDGSVRQKSLRLRAPMPVQANGDDFTRFRFADSDGREIEALQREYQFPGDHSVVVTFGVDAVLADQFAAQQREALWQRLSPLLVVTTLLAIALVVLLILIVIAPIRRLQRDLARIESGRSGRLEMAYPGELRELTTIFNKHLERSEATLSRYSELASNMAHAIKTPLTALRLDAASPQQIARIDAIDALVERNLARARIVGGEQHNAATVAVLPLLERLVRSYDKLFDVDIELSSAQRLVFSGNPQDLVEATGNVLENACRFATARVTISVANGRLAISDDGPGIASPDRDAVLRRGVRLDEATSGSGIGLPIAQDIAAAYDGSITIDDSEEGGALVTLWLPTLVAS